MWVDNDVPELIPDIEQLLPITIFKMATTKPQEFNIVRYHLNLIVGKLWCPEFIPDNENF